MPLTSRQVLRPEPVPVGNTPVDVGNSQKVDTSPFGFRCYSAPITENKTGFNGEFKLIEIFKDAKEPFFDNLLSTRTGVVGLVASALLVIAGPFGTFEAMSFTERLVFWPSLIALSLILSYFVRAVVTVFASEQTQIYRDGLVIVVFSTLYTPVPILIASVVDRGREAPVMGVVEAYLMIFIISSGVVIVRHVFNLEKNPGPTDTDSRPRFLRRLDGNVLPEQVLRLTVEDHYVEVYLTTGETQRILIRFADAVDEMDGLPGMCVHRSHWVAAQAIKGIERGGGRDFVVLSDDSRVPVSRTYRPDLVEAGWIVDRRLKSAAPAAGAGRSTPQTPLVRTKF